jgi:hypothetical protein
MGVDAGLSFSCSDGRSVGHSRCPPTRFQFAHNCWKHEEDLTIRYRGLRRVHADVEVTDLPGKFAVVLDEILPHPDGCRHEIAFRGGTMVVVARDLTAVWNEADCPDKPGRRGEGR